MSHVWWQRHPISCATSLPASYERPPMLPQARPSHAHHSEPQGEILFLGNTPPTNQNYLCIYYTPSTTWATTHTDLLTSRSLGSGEKWNRVTDRSFLFNKCELWCARKQLGNSHSVLRGRKVDQTEKPLFLAQWERGGHRAKHCPQKRGRDRQIQESHIPWAGTHKWKPPQEPGPGRKSWTVITSGDPGIGGAPQCCEIYFQELDQVPTVINTGETSPQVSTAGGKRNHSATARVLSS